MKKYLNVENRYCVDDFIKCNKLRGDACIVVIQITKVDNNMVFSVGDIVTAFLLEDSFLAIAEHYNIGFEKANVLRSVTIASN